MKMQRIQNSENNLEKENKIERLILPKFKAYYKATLIKIVWHWCKDKEIDQWHRNKSPEINLYTWTNGF